jgi:hypothetical protein
MYNMSLLKIPFSISIFLAVYTTMTAPQPTPEAKERAEPSGLEVIAMPFFLKVPGRFFGLKGSFTFL